MSPSYTSTLDLYFFRRAIKVCETCNPESLSAFTKLTGAFLCIQASTRLIYFLGCESIVAGQLFKRLETEGSLFLTCSKISMLTNRQDLLRWRARNKTTSGLWKQTRGRRRARTRKGVNQNKRAARQCRNRGIFLFVKLKRRKSTRTTSTPTRKSKSGF